MSIETKQLAPIEQVRNSLKLMEPQFKMALPSHISPDKFTRVVMTSIQQNPNLLNADRSSLFSACMKSAADGLLPDSKHAAMVMFKDKVQYMPMVAGLLKLVRQSGEIQSITTQIVYERDNFKYWVNQDGENLIHEPSFFHDNGKEIGAYALARTKDGGVYIEVMTEKQINDVRNVSRSKDSGPWSGPFRLEMWKKTVLRRLIKRLPVSTDIDQVILNDDDNYEIQPVNEKQAVEKKVELLEPKKKKSRLEQVVDVSEVTEEKESEI